METNFATMATLKLFHLLFLFIWMGSLLTLTRFLGYLPKEEPAVQKRFIALFRRMYLVIDLPAMILALGSGVALFVVKRLDFSHGWLHMKLTFAFFIIVCDVILGRTILKLGKKSPGLKSRRFKILHGTAALCLLALLSSVYIVKNKVSEHSSLAKKEENRMILPLQPERNS